MKDASEDAEDAPEVRPAISTRDNSGLEQIDFPPRECGGEGRAAPSWVPKQYTLVVVMQISVFQTVRKNINAIRPVPYCDARTIRNRSNCIYVFSNQFQYQIIEQT